jgi:hypothetical protein
MPRPPILDKKIMSKIAKKINTRDITAINRMVYRKSRNLGISSEAALIILAKEYDIGTSTYQRSLDATKQAEVMYALQTIFAPKARTLSNGKRTVQKKGKWVERNSSRVPWLTLNPNLYGIGFDIKKFKCFEKWFGKKHSYKNG